MSERPDLSNQMAEAAKAFAARGWRPVRLHGVDDQGHCTCPKGVQPTHRSQAGKHPTDNAWASAPPMTDAEIDAAWSGWRSGHNVGIATGRASGFFALDIDPDNGGAESVKLLQQEQGKLTPSVMQRTGSGGWHVLYLMPADFEPTNRRGGLQGYPGLDVRGTGGQIVAAPSRSAKGPYTWRAGDEAAEIQPAPGWLLDLLRPAPAPEAPAVVPASAPSPAVRPGSEQDRLETYARTARDLEVARLTRMRESAVPEGQQYTGDPWNETTFKVACSLLELANSPWTAYSPAEAGADVLANAPRDAGFTDAEIVKTMDSALSKVGGQARPYPSARPSLADEVAEWAEEAGVKTDPLVFKGAAPPPGVTLAVDVDDVPSSPPRSWDDLGNAMRVADHYRGRLRWIGERGEWAVYGAGRWKIEPANVVQGMVQDMVDTLIPASEAMHYSDEATDEDKPEETERAGFLKWLKAQRMSSRMTAARTEAAGRPELQATMADFDVDPMLFNCRNCVVDLRDGSSLPHDPKLLLMHQSPVDYNPAAAAPRWDRFLERMQPDQAMRGYLQRIAGYSMTADTSAQAFFIHHGDGANGKSIFSDAVAAVMGDYGAVVSPSTLLSSTQEQHPTGMAMMEGKRWLPCTETGVGKRLDEEKIKNLTGDAQVSARKMGENFSDFTPTGKLHLITNHLPWLSDAKSIWRRTHLVKWGVTLEEHEWDLTLGQTLKENELAGVLAWLVRGATAWREQGLNPPAVALEDKGIYREDSDVFGDFLRETTLPADESVLTSTKALYDAYQTWAFAGGIRKPMSQMAFSAALTERGYNRHRVSSARGFQGIVVVGQHQAAATYPW